MKTKCSDFEEQMKVLLDCGEHHVCRNLLWMLKVNGCMFLLLHEVYCCTGNVKTYTV